MLRELARRAGNHGCSQGKRCRQAGDRSDQPEHLAYSHLPFYSHHSRLIPFFSLDILGIDCTVREIDFFNLIPGSEKVEKDRLIHSPLTEFEVISVNRRFGAVFRRYIEPGASGGQNVQDAVDQSARVTPRSTDVRLRWGEIVLNNLP